MPRRDDRRHARAGRRAIVLGVGGAVAVAGGTALRRRAASGRVALSPDPHHLGAGVGTPLSDLAALARVEGGGEPVCLIDLDALDANLDRLLADAMRQDLALRPALKSLPSPGLAAHVLGRLPEPRGMVFHLRHVEPLVAACPPGLDLLTGYVPTPGELARHLQRRGPATPHRVRITIDELELLDLAIELARESPRVGPIELAVELDAGAGRGGFAGVDEVAAVGRRLQEARDAVRVTAVLCYDAHATLTPRTSVRRVVAADARRRLRRLHDALRTAAGDAIDELEVNGPGSANHRQWEGDDLLTEFSPGSALLYARYLQAGFDDEGLSVACLLAAPVLRRVGPLPRVPLTRRPVPGRRREQLMLKGGGWPTAGGTQPTMVWPAGLEENELYGGRGNNTGTIAAPPGRLHPGDVILLWPHQVGDAIEYFGAVTVVRAGEVVDRWPTLPRWGG